jgi:hypothetical protein
MIVRKAISADNQELSHHPLETEAVLLLLFPFTAHFVFVNKMDALTEYYKSVCNTQKLKKIFCCSFSFKNSRPPLDSGILAYLIRLSRSLECLWLPREKIRSLLLPYLILKIWTRESRLVILTMKAIDASNDFFFFGSSYTALVSAWRDVRIQFTLMMREFFFDLEYLFRIEFDHAFLYRFSLTLLL